MDIRKLQRAIVDALEDVKAQDIVVFNTEELSALFERVIVASGSSNRQTKALAASVRDKVKEIGGDLLAVEGEDNGEWIIVDCGQAVVHVMQPGIRQYYHLEEIWGGKPVRLKVASEKKSLPKASEPMARVKPVAATQVSAEDEDDAPKGRRAPARKAAGKTSSRSAAKTPAAAPVAKRTRSTSTRKNPEAEVQSKVEAQRAARAAAVEAGEKIAAKGAKTAAPRKTAARKTAPVEQKIVVKSAPRKSASTSAKPAGKRPARKTSAA